MNGKHYTYRFKTDKEKLNFTYHPGTNTYTTPPVERKSTLPPKLDDQRHTPEKGDSPTPDTPPRLVLEENRDPDPERINLNPIGPELNPIPEVNPIAPEGPVISNIPEVIPKPNPEPIPEVIPEDPEPLGPEQEEILPEIIEDIEMPGGDQPKYQLRDLPKFGGEKTEDQIEFVYQFENFLRYISHNVENPASVEKALTYLGQHQVLKIKMSSPSAEVYSRLIMQSTTIENIINLINQMQAINFQSVQPCMPNTAMPLMAAQIEMTKSK